jgi:uroporphyrinogen-III synthase
MTRPMVAHTAADRMSRLVVANTRPREQAAELSQLLRAAGFEPLEAPATFTAPAFDPLELTPILAQLRHYAWLVLPSRNAGHFLSVAASAKVCQGANVVCGRATADALGLRSAVTLNEFSAAAALDWLRPRLAPGDRVLIPRAAEGRDELIAGLREHGVEIDAPVVYRTEPAQPPALAPLADRVRAGEVAAVTFCSPSAVNAVASAVNLTSVRCVCLGETTAQAARTTGARVDAVASETNMRSLVEAVQQALAGVAA